MTKHLDVKVRLKKPAAADLRDVEERIHGVVTKALCELATAVPELAITSFTVRDLDYPTRRSVVSFSRKPL
jgi:hypothetical protein